MIKKQLRTRILRFKERSDGYTEVTLLIDRHRDKSIFYNMVNHYRDNTAVVFDWVDDND